MISRPRIGITCSPLRPHQYYGPYLRAVEAAGAEAVQLTAVARETRHQSPVTALANLDGLLLPGGWDVDPPAYGEPRGSGTNLFDPALDSTEVALIRSAVATSVPVFGICRGTQVINVALGGSLHQHVDAHDLHAHPRNFLAHPIEVVQDSELGRVAGASRLMVNSLHHQSVKDVAPGLRVTAYSPDGVVEGVESLDCLVIGVQCHPEELFDEHQWARSILERFVSRVRQRA